MKSLEILTNMISEAKDQTTERLIYEIYYLVREIVREEIKAMTDEINIITLLNGRRADIPEIKDMILRMIKEELR